MKTDYNCFVGAWPFIKRRQIDFDGLRRMHEKHEIESGFVSSLGAVFYNDPFEGDFDLAKKLKGSGYSQAVSINPMLPNIAYDIQRADESFNYDAFRIYPTIHGYDFDTPQFIEFHHMASQKKKPVIIHCSFGDIRLDYLFKQKPFEIESLTRFLSTGMRTPVVLCNMRHGSMIDMAKTLSADNNIFVDMSEMRHSMFSLDDMADAKLLNKVVFGAFYPVFDFLATYMHFDGVADNICSDILNRKII